jgi:hypothetical protein
VATPYVCSPVSPLYWLAALPPILLIAASLVGKRLMSRHRGGSRGGQQIRAVSKS